MKPHTTPKVIATLALVAASWCTSASAQQDAPDAFDAGVEALNSGAHAEAVDEFESLADRGTVNPNASYNRGLAYAARAQSSAARPGDLGQAAAAFQEALLLHPSDDEARQGLSLVHEELARQRSRRSKAFVTSEPFPEVLVALLPEPVWAILAVLASIIASAAVGARGWLRGKSIRLSAATTAWVATAVFAVSLFGWFIAQRERTDYTPAVVLAKEAPLLDELGHPAAADPTRPKSIPEGTQVDVDESRGRLTHVRWGTESGWLLSNQLRPLARP